MQITVSSTEIPNYRGGGASATLRIYADRPFTTSDDERILQGRGDDWYQSVDCTVSSTTLTIPEFTIASTVDSSVPNATYSGVLYDSSSNKVNALFSGYRIPAATPLTWAYIHAYNDGIAPRLNSEYLNADQVTTLIEQRIASKMDETAIVKAAPADNFVIAAKTVLTPVEDMVLNVEAESYSVDGFLYVTCDPTAGFKFNLAAGTATENGTDYQIELIVAETDTGTVLAYGGMVGNDTTKTVTGFNSFTLRLIGRVTFQTAGTFQLQAAQSVSDLSNTTLWTYSNIVLTKL